MGTRWQEDRARQSRRLRRRPRTRLTRRQNEGLGRAAGAAADARQPAGAAGEDARPVAPLRLGITPADAVPITVRDGVVHIGKDAAVNFDTGDVVKVASDATPEQIKTALRDAGAVSRRSKFFGGVAKAARSRRMRAHTGGVRRVSGFHDRGALTRGGEPTGIRGNTRSGIVPHPPRMNGRRKLPRTGASLPPPIPRRWNAPSSSCARM
jgi:hypothetical protein